MAGVGLRLLILGVSYVAGRGLRKVLRARAQVSVGWHLIHTLRYYRQYEFHALVYKLRASTPRTMAFETNSKSEFETTEGRGCKESWNQITKK